MRIIRVVLPAVAIAMAMSCARGGTGEWPARPVKVIVPFDPGSGTDLVVRLLAPRLAERWGQPVVVDNRPGADGVAGVQAFLSAPPLLELPPRQTCRGQAKPAIRF